MNIVEQLQINFHYNTICSLSCISPDQVSILPTIYETLVRPQNLIFFKYSLATDLQEAVISQNNFLAGWADTQKMEIAPKTANPFRHYLQKFIEYKDDCFLIIQDIERFIGKKDTDWVIISLLKEIYHLKNDPEIQKKILILSEETTLFDELIRQIPSLKIPLPDKNKIAHSLSENLRGLPTTVLELDEIAQCATGLSINEVFDVCSKTNYQTRFLDLDKLKTNLFKYKCKLLLSQGIELIDIIDIPEVGGHDEFMKWIREIEPFRNPSISEELGIPAPKGCFLAGIPGCGKTLIAKMIAKSWNLPLFILNLPSLKGSLVGESENNLRKTLNLIDTQEGIVLIDEADKAINTQSKNDSSGVGSGMLSILLPWLQETHNFVVMTANDPTVVPQELTRDGRLDTRWFVDLPDKEERYQILKIHCTRKNRVVMDAKLLETTLVAIADTTENYSGSELEQLVLKTLRKCYLKGKPKYPQIADFRESIQEITPLAVSFPEQHEKLKQWARNASCTKRKSYQ